MIEVKGYMDGGLKRGGGGGLYLSCVCAGRCRWPPCKPWPFLKTLTVFQTYLLQGIASFCGFNLLFDFVLRR